MSNTSNASKNVKRFLLLFALGIAYGFMYVMPYMKSSFYDQMISLPKLWDNRVRRSQFWECVIQS